MGDADKGMKILGSLAWTLDYKDTQKIPQLVRGG